MTLDYLQYQDSRIGWCLLDAKLITQTLLLKTKKKKKKKKKERHATQGTNLAKQTDWL